MGTACLWTPQHQLSQLPGWVTHCWGLESFELCPHICSGCLSARTSVRGQTEQVRSVSTMFSDRTVWGLYSVSCGCHNKIPQTELLRTTEIYQSSPSQQSTCKMSMGPRSLEVLEQSPSLPHAASVGSYSPRLVAVGGALSLPLSPQAFSLWICANLLSPHSSTGHIGSRVRPDPA